MLHFSVSLMNRLNKPSSQFSPFYFGLDAQVYRNNYDYKINTYCKFYLQYTHLSKINPKETENCQSENCQY